MKKRFLAIFMIVLMLFSNVATLASGVNVAEEAENSDAVDDLESVYSEENLDELIVLKEITELREENVKHFNLSNGINKAVLYPQPVHYMDENGNWIDIDNSLTLQGNEYSTNNKTKIKFANKSGSNGLLSIKDGDYEIDFTPLNTNKVNVVIENPQESNSRKFDDVKKLNGLISKATYSNIYDGIDIEYILTGNNIKENIIVNSKQDSYIYSFELKLNKLTAELSNGSIILSDSATGEKVYTIPVPYMVDANGTYSMDVEYSLEQTNKWKYTFTVTADADWINNEAILPITIDPTISAESSVTDFFIMKDDEEFYINEQTIKVGNFMGIDTIGFIKYNNLIEIPSGNYIISAYATLYNYNVGGYTTPDLVISAYEATSNALGYNAKDLYNAVVDSNAQELSCIPVVQEGFCKWDIATLYEKWIKNSSTNHGIYLRSKNLSNNSSSAASFMASETNGHIWPQLEVTYTSDRGVENYFAMFQNNIGQNGKSYINLFNGRLTYVHNLTNITTENNSYPINLVYDSFQKEWKCSYEEKILPLDGNEGVERYVWQDEDGTNHFFSPYVEKNYWGYNISYEISQSGTKHEVTNPTIFYPEDDNDIFVLEKTSLNEFVLKYEDGTQKYFDFLGNLTKICYSNGDVLYFYQISSENDEYTQIKISTIICKYASGEIEKKAYFDYNTITKLNYLYNYETGLEISLNWISNLRLDTISYINENQNEIQQMKFSYDSNKYLNNIEDCINQESINFTINTSNEYYKAKKFEDQILKKEHSVQYNENQTYLTSSGILIDSNSDDVIYQYVFDEKGRKILVINEECEEVHTYSNGLFIKLEYMTVQYNQNVYKEPYTSEASAAIAFGELYYEISCYVKHEFGAYIYAINYNNETTYNFTNVVYGKPHSVRVFVFSTDLKTFTSNVHIHPHEGTGDFSIEDINTYTLKNIDGYLLIRGNRIKKYEISTRTSSELGEFQTDPLKNKQKDLLRIKFNNSWENHKDDCDFCNTSTWPNE